MEPLAPPVDVRVQDEDEPAGAEREAPPPFRRAVPADPPRPAGARGGGAEGPRAVPPGPPPARLRPVPGSPPPPAGPRVAPPDVRPARPGGGVAPPRAVRGPARRPRGGGAGDDAAAACGLLLPPGRAAGEGAGRRPRPSPGAPEGVPPRAPGRRRPAAARTAGGGSPRRADGRHSAVRPHGLERREGVGLDGAEALPPARDGPRVRPDVSVAGRFVP